MKNKTKIDKKMRHFRTVSLVSFIFIIILSIIIIKPINDLDEIWNYNTARAISEGLVPYKDISMITTPLLPAITAIILKIIANEIIVSRIIAACIWTGILFTTYKILKNIIKEENTCLIFTALIGILCRNIYCIDYNITTLFIALIILYQELKNIENIEDIGKIGNKNSINNTKINYKYEFSIRNISRISNMHKTKYRSYTCRNYSDI